MAETYESHLAWILSRIGLTETSYQPLHLAHGLALAEDAVAVHDLPMWDASAMDGYAVRAAELAQASSENPVLLKIVGEIAAGSSADPTLAPAQTVRIMTGAPVPTDADAIVPVELTISDQPGDPWALTVTHVHTSVQPGAHIRRQGEDVRAGGTVEVAGARINAARASALAAAGRSIVLTHRAPRIAVVTTGSELMPPAATLARGQIHESNSLLLRGLLLEAGFDTASVEHCGDDADRFALRLRELAADHDVIITSGGVGPGQHDVVRIALEPEPDIRSVRVLMRPGQPQCTGRHRAGAFVFGLPGNPVSTAVSFEMFVLPALSALAGFSRVHRPRLTATATEGWRAASGRLQVLPVRLADTPSGLTCEPAVPASRVSHSVAGHATRDGYALIGPEHGDVTVGDQVPVIATDLR